METATLRSGRVLIESAARSSVSGSVVIACGSGVATLTPPTVAPAACGEQERAVDSLVTYCWRFLHPTTYCSPPTAEHGVRSGVRSGPSWGMKVRTPNSVTLPTLIDMAMAAEHLGVSLRHVRRLVAEKRIPYVKVGHFVRFDPGELVQWIDEHRIEPCQSRRGA